jgi:protease I
MSNILMIIAQKNFRDEELLIPKEMLTNAGHSVKIASLTRANASGMRGAQINPDMAVHEASPDYFDTIIVVGGSGSPALAQSNDVMKLLQGASSKGRLIGAICLGPMSLAAAGLLSGKKATVFKTEDSIQALKDGGATYTGEDVTVDGKLVTASGPHAANEFAKKIIEMLKA